MNTNFHNIHKTEQQISDTVNVVIKSLKTTQKSDLESKSRIVTTQLAEYFSEIQNLYLTSLQTLIEKLEIPSQIMFIQALATETQFCEFPNCFETQTLILNTKPNTDLTRRKLNFGYHEGCK